MAEFFLKSGCAFAGTAGFGHILAKNLRNSVGESGSGKSVAMLALMGLLPWTAQITADKLEFDGKDLGRISRRDHRKIFGKDISMIFQEPTSSLNPCFTVGF